MILILSAILFILLITINKKRGLKAFISLYVNLFFVILAVVFIARGLNPILVALIFSLGTSAFILFYINGFNIKTKIAYLSVASVIILMTIFIILFVTQSNMYGFVREHAGELFAFSQNVNINFINVTIAMQIMLLTAALTDTALDISTSLYEVYENNPKISFKNLVGSGKNMGSDALGTKINTLFFIFIANFMGFFFFYWQVEFSHVVNHKLLLQEISELFIVAIGCVLIIPLVIFIQSYIFTKKDFISKTKNKRTI